MKSMTNSNCIYNSLFVNKLYEISRQAYEMTIEYLKQEKVFDDEEFVIVDSGWVGSVQHSFRRLFDSQGFKPKIVGFYFGLYKKPNQKEDGEYLTYYFNTNSHMKNKIYFDNNVFECLLLSNNGMTLGYKKDEGGVVRPYYRKYNNDMKDLLDAKKEGVLKYCDDHLTDFVNFEYKKSLKNTFHILKKLMVYPCGEEVEIFNNIYFCDDISESYHVKMLDSEDAKYLKSYTIFSSIKRKFFHIASRTTRILYWPYGSIYYVKPVLRPWYRANLMILNFLRFIFKK